MPEWLSKGIQLIKRNKDKKQDRAFNELSQLLTLYDLYCEYENHFKEKLSWYCNKFNCSLDSFVSYINEHKEEYEQFKKGIHSRDYQMIRTNKKIHFWMNSGTIKISTINSFKGWESELLFLILEKKYDTSTTFNMSFDELLYTGITRCRSNLIIINFGNEEYDSKIRPIIDSIK
ncbi:hypothetical protein Barb6_02456 [Bacteroidales bacterium Barb6]|nr:hypothetical protein Barb6_02456 [Bacteroidales bacterium Barb6]